MLKDAAVRFLTMLIEYFTSKKTFTAIVAIGSSFFIHDAQKRLELIIVGVGLILGIGAADLGKVAAQISADSASSPPPPPVPSPSPAPPPAPSGYA